MIVTARGTVPGIKIIISAQTAKIIFDIFRRYDYNYPVLLVFLLKSSEKGLHAVSEDFFILEGL
jgi:hypothetical protein